MMQNVMKKGRGGMKKGGKVQKKSMGGDIAKTLNEKSGLGLDPRLAELIGDIGEYGIRKYGHKFMKKGGPVQARGLGGDIGGALGGSFGGPLGNIVGRGLGDAAGHVFGFKKGGKVNDPMSHVRICGLGGDIGAALGSSLGPIGGIGGRALGDVAGHVFGFARGGVVKEVAKHSVF